MLSTRTSRWTAATAALCVALIVATWFLLIAPRRGDAARLADQRASAQAANDTLRVRIAQLKSQFSELSTKQAELAAVQRELPPTADLPKLVRDLSGIADGAGVRLDSLTPGAASYVKETPGQTAAPAKGSLVSIPVAVVVTGDYFQAALFLRKLQTQLHRGFLVTALSVKPGDTGTGTTSGTVSMTLNGSVFVLPTSAGSAAALTGGAATTSAAGTASTGGAATSSAGQPAATTGSTGQPAGSASGSVTR